MIVPPRLIVLLDSGPLGLVTNPNATPEAVACRQWLTDLPNAGHLPLVPAIIDYELRRELQLANLRRALRNLETLKTLGYCPLTEAALLRAADFWTQARRQGMPTADRLALDADVILAGQAATLDPNEWGMARAGVVVATDNVGHLSRYVDARHWQEISVE